MFDMKLRIGFVVLIVLLAGCSAPVPDSTSTPESTTMEPTGIEGEILNTSVNDRVVTARVSLTNHDDEIADVSIALRFTENSSHAMVGDIRLDPGETRTLTVPLQTYGEDPENLTVQFRIDGEIVDEKAAV